MAGLPSSVHRWLRDQHEDSAARVAPLPSTQGEVWQVDTVRGARWAIKRASPATTDREAQGLNTAGPIGQTPYVEARLDTRTLVLTWHEGEASLEPVTVRAAGAWLRRLHDLPVADVDPMPIPEALERRVQSWLSRAPADLELPQQLLTAATFAGTKRAPCHRDFTPDNWLWTPQGALTVIDFGQSRPDLPLWDLVKLEGELFRQRPEVRPAFFESYGTLTDEDAERLRQLTRLHGLQTAIWGDLHGEPHFSALGRAILVD